LVARGTAGVALTPLLADGTLDLVNTMAQVGQLLVVTGAAIAAVVQIRHLRASNELQGLLTFTQQLRETELRDALHYAQNQLAERLRDPAYRAELVGRGFIDSRRHPEVFACNWFDQAGALVKNRLIDQTTFLDLFSRLVVHYWECLEPVVALLRRARPDQYENFEYLARLAHAWRARHPKGTYPPKLERLNPIDRWLDETAAPP